MEKTFKTKDYWENRYALGGTSGTGSYGGSGTLKANIINRLISKYQIKTINDLGHGDGNNITLLKGMDKYYGYDVSKTARSICTSKFKEQPVYTFLSRLSQFKKRDMAMSLDVLYHLVEDKVYYNYLDRLFSLGQYVLIYSINEDTVGNDHVSAREFTTHIENTYKDFNLIETINGFTSEISFYLYRKT